MGGVIESFKVRSAAYEKIDIPVLVIIEECSSPANRFNNIAEFIITDGMDKIQPRILPDFLEEVPAFLAPVITGNQQRKYNQKKIKLVSGFH
jgi:hypothetical protein